MKKSTYFLVFLILMFPTIAGYYINTREVFSGLTIPTDANTYLSFMNQAKEGHILFTNIYTSEEVPYLLFRPTYLIAGWFAYMTRLPNVIVYHLFRLLGVLVFIFFLEKLFSIYFKNKKERLVTLLLCLFASGIGFFLRLLSLLGTKQYLSVDLWVSDSNNFLILLGHPHTIFSVAFMTASVYFFLKWNKEGKIKQIILSAVFAFILGLEHLYSVITLCSIMGVFILIQFLSRKRIDWRKVKHLAVFAIIISLPVIYTWVIFTKFPSFESWNLQNTLDTPKIPYVVAGYGLMFIAFILTILSKNKETKKEEVWFLVYWIIIVFILIYSPFNIQRKFLEGVHIPFGIITGIFLYKLLRPKLATILDNNIADYLIFLLVILMVMTNIYVYANQITNLDNGRGSFPYSVNRYLYKEEVEALKWLAKNSKEDGAILSAYNIGNYIPAYMNRRVFLGHWSQTIDFDKKKADVDKFFSINGDNFRKELIKNYNIGYVYYGIDEKKLGTFNPDYMEKVFENDKVMIFKVG